jgi:hypothetical protein
MPVGSFDGFGDVDMEDESLANALETAEALAELVAQQSETEEEDVLDFDSHLSGKSLDVNGRITTTNPLANDTGFTSSFGINNQSDGRDHVPDLYVICVASAWPNSCSAETVAEMCIKCTDEMHMEMHLYLVPPCGLTTRCTPL